MPGDTRIPQLRRAENGNGNSGRQPFPCMPGILSEDTIPITLDTFQAAKSAKGGWTKKQVELLGVQWPPRKGWLRGMIGDKFPRSTLEKFVAMRKTPARTLFDLPLQ